MGETRFRVFAAVPIPHETQLAVDRWRSALPSPLGSSGPGPGSGSGSGSGEGSVRPVPVGNFHLTLRFAGEVERVGLERLCAALDQAETPAPFKMGLGGLGAFPKPSRATTAWLGVESGRDSLARLAEAAEEAARAAGRPPEERPFHPHLTLARFRPPVDLRPAGAGGRDDPAGSPAARLGVKVTVTKVVLYRSFLGKKPARYQVMETFPL